uniref:Uncharacterized protein n=1 Tax=Panagrolaimus davidi TaxID=227884 RepID=A0A914QF27_9BILA
MSLLPPEKWRFCKPIPASSEENNMTKPGTSFESTQISTSLSPQTHSTLRSPIPRLNKNHGFIKHIIQNQIERDEYEKISALNRAKSEEPNNQMNKIGYNSPLTRKSITSPQISTSVSPQTSSPSSTLRSPMPRINKNHGFIKHIIQNQIERDEYEKIIAQNREPNNQMNKNGYNSPLTRKLITSPQIQSQFSAVNNTLQDDPYSEFRVRARRSLQREGIL